MKFIKKTAVALVLFLSGLVGYGQSHVPTLQSNNNWLGYNSFTAGHLSLGTISQTCPGGQFVTGFTSSLVPICQAVSGSGVTSVNAATGVITFAGGTSISVTPTGGGNFTIAYTGSAGGVTSINSASGPITLANGANISIVQSPAGTFTINSSATTGIASINGDTTGAQVLSCTTPIHCVTSGGTTTFTFSGSAGTGTVVGGNPYQVAGYGAAGGTSVQSIPGIYYITNTMSLQQINALLNTTTLTLTAASAPSGGNTTYTGTINGAANAYAGDSFTVAGFANAGNNGTFTVVSSTATTLVVTNSGGVAETHAGSATDTSTAPALSTVIVTANVAQLGWNNSRNLHITDTRNGAAYMQAAQYGLACDAGSYYVTVTAGLNYVNVGSNLSNSVGQTVTIASKSGMGYGFTQQDWEPTIVSYSYPYIYLSGNAPFSFTGWVNTGTDNTANFNNVAFPAIGNVFPLLLPAGCNYLLASGPIIWNNAQSIIGQQMNNSGFVSAPAMDILQSPDTVGGGSPQGNGVQVYDFSFNLDTRLDATFPHTHWNAAGTSSVVVPAFNRPILEVSPNANNPLGNDWCTGCNNAVAAITQNSAVICVPNALGRTFTNNQILVFPYLTTVFVSAVLNTTGSGCAGGNTGVTMYTAFPNTSGYTSSQAYFEYGTAYNSLETNIPTSVTYPLTITTSLANAPNPTGGIYNFAGHGHVRISQCNLEADYLGSNLSATPGAGTITLRRGPASSSGCFNTALTLSSVATTSGGVAVYTGTITGGASNGLVGQMFKVAGFTSTFTLTAASAASGSSTTYTGTINGGASNAYAGLSFTIAGFTNATNNGTFVVSASTATTLVVTNAGGIAETHAATAANASGNNNGTFFASASSSTTLTLVNTGAITESHAATAQDQPVIIPFNTCYATYESPYPVVPNINSATQVTPVGAAYFAGQCVGQAGMAFPTADANINSTNGLTNSFVKHLAFQPSNGQPQDFNQAAGIYCAGLVCGQETDYDDIKDNYLEFGYVQGPASLNNWASNRTGPTYTGNHFENCTMRGSAFTFVLAEWQQGDIQRCDMYSGYISPYDGSNVGSGTCLTLGTTYNEQGGYINALVAQYVVKSWNCEPASGGSGAEIPVFTDIESTEASFEQDTFEGGYNVFGGSQNTLTAANILAVPSINYGTLNTFNGILGMSIGYITNAWGANNQFFNWGKLSTCNAYLGGTGPLVACGPGFVQPWAGHSAESAAMGVEGFENSLGGIIAPNEWNTNGSYDSGPMTSNFNIDPTEPIWGNFASCYLYISSGNCKSGHWSGLNGTIYIGNHNRIAPVPYVLEANFKWATVPTGNFVMYVAGFDSGSGQCASPGIIASPGFTVTNGWTHISYPINFTGKQGCSLQVQFYNSSVTDTLDVGEYTFVPVPNWMNFNVVSSSIYNQSCSVSGRFYGFDASGYAYACINGTIKRVLFN